MKNKNYDRKSQIWSEGGDNEVLIYLIINFLGIFN